MWTVDNLRTDREPVKSARDDLGRAWADDAIRYDALRRMQQRLKAGVDAPILIATMAESQAKGEQPGRALLAAVPRRHLESALIVQQRRGRVALPALEVGDLRDAEPGTDVYLYAHGEDGRQLPAATWRARLLRWAPAEPDGRHPDDGDLVPPSLVEEMRVAREVLASVPQDPVTTADEGRDQLGGGEGAGAYFEVEGLEELPKRAWLFTNELVSKGDRGARYFMPRVPVLVQLPD